MSRGRKSIYDDRKHTLAAARFRRFYERNKLSLKVKRRLIREKIEQSRCEVSDEELERRILAFPLH
jgi:hypothetical protein